MLALEVRTPSGALELDLALEVGPGECLALAGPSGAGKTSVLRVVAGAAHAPPRARSLRRAKPGWTPSAGVDLPPERRRVGYVFQDYALFPQPQRLAQRGLWDRRTRPRAQRRERALELLDRFGMADLADARPATLSGGERQRVALARALARRPQALLLDEPLSALDARTRARAGASSAALMRDAEVPALLVTHDFEEAALLADRVAIMDGGAVVQTGTAAELAAAPASAFVADLTGAVVLTGTAQADGRAHGGRARRRRRIVRAPTPASGPWR